MLRVDLVSTAEVRFKASDDVSVSRFGAFVVAGKREPGAYRTAACTRWVEKNDNVIISFHCGPSQLGWCYVPWTGRLRRTIIVAHSVAGAVVLVLSLVRVSFVAVYHAHEEHTEHWLVRVVATIVGYDGVVPSITVYRIRILLGRRAD